MIFTHKIPPKTKTADLITEIGGSNFRLVAFGYPQILLGLRRWAIT